MRVIDSFPQMGRAFERGEFSIAAWRRYAAEISPALPEKLEADAAEYDFAGAVLPVLQQFYEKSEQAALAHASFQKLVGGLSEKFCSVLGSAPEADVILCLGLCNGAGWATSLGGRPVVLLGIEKIVELGWCGEADMAALLYHELGHLWHFQRRTAPAWAEDPAARALWQLYTEGMATYVQQRLFGGRSFYSQDRDGWLAWCGAHRARLFAAFRRRVDGGESVQDFFGDWCAFEGRSDVGYYLGAELVYALAENRSPQQLADLNPDEVYGMLAAL